MVKTAVLLAVLLLAGFGHALAADKIYKWTDDNGVVHYSATPPEGPESEAVSIRPGPPPPPAAVEAQVGSSEADLRAANCVSSRARLQVLLDNQLVEIEQVDGTRTQLSADERTAEITRSEAEVDRWCSAPATE
jgi:hypothetical protein